MPKFIAIALLGAASILLLAGLGRSEAPVATRAAALPPIAADAQLANAPRECSVADNVTTACTYP